MDGLNSALTRGKATVLTEYQLSSLTFLVRTGCFIRSLAVLPSFIIRSRGASYAVHAGCVSLEATLSIYFRKSRRRLGLEIASVLLSVETFFDTRRRCHFLP